jgi:hypothetical protein
VFVADGLRNGFTAGVQREQLHGQRIFRNYKSCTDAMEQVGRATQARIDSGKTLCLGEWARVHETLRQEVQEFYCFPLGAVPKPLEPTEVRPASDHTRTGLNAATDMSRLKHALTAHQDVAWMLKTGYFMYVTDVEAAFPMLPLAPWLWWFMLFRACLPGNSRQAMLCMHTHGDFGTRGMPGCFYIFFVRVVIPMARCEMIISLPLAIYVDDCAMCGPAKIELDGEMAELQAWCQRVCGVAFKAIKDKAGARCQLYVGFWWDSLQRTRTLEEHKLVGYVAEFLAFAEGKRTVSLHDLRSLAGKAQRAVLTLPPGAGCLLVNFFLLMSGLTLPWQKRRIPKAAKVDARFLAMLLRLNLGRGYFSYDQFGRAHMVLSDASRAARYAGGGYVSASGAYRFWQYGSSAAHQPIDYLEGDTCLVAVDDLGHTWQGCMVPFGIDNMSFQRSEAKGRSRAPRLNDLLKGLFVMQIQGGFILDSFWLSSEDNLLADDLSRDREADFLRHAYATGFWHAGVTPVRHLACGARRTLSQQERPDALHALRQLLDTYSSNADKDGPTGGPRFADSVPHARCALTEGLPGELETWLNEVLDHRFAASSWRTINGGMNKWRAVAAKHGWPALIESDDPRRGGKMVAFLHALCADTQLTWGSILNYTWGMRTFHRLQHKADPALGVDHWDMLEQAVKVLTHVPAEPRKEIPLTVLRAILEALDPSVFREAQFGFFLLIMLYTFSRSECPCPKTFDGAENFDVRQHWCVGDIRFEITVGRRGFRVRFKMVKQDGRVQRPAANGPDPGEKGDWSFVGDVEEDLFSPVRWYHRLLQLWPASRPSGEPFFLDKDMRRPYTYSAALADMAMMLQRVGCSDSYGIHSLRVSGYNWSKRGSGEDITVAHGLWKSHAHNRYSRWGMNEILDIPRNMFLEHPDQLAVPAPRQEERPAGRPPLMTRQGAMREPGGGPSVDSSGGSSADSDGAPPRMCDGEVAAQLVADAAQRAHRRAEAHRAAQQAARGAPVVRTTRVTRRP